jgi:class 3 adenylate cyclase
MLRSLNAVAMSKKTVVELDLVGYSDVSRELEQHLGPEVVARFNEQIQEFVDTSLRSAAIARAEVVIATTGDGTILASDRPQDAHVFAVGLHRCVQEHNKRCQLVSAQRWFRTGLATGELYQSPSGSHAGTVIATAVRLETAARPGEIVADALHLRNFRASCRPCTGRRNRLRASARSVSRLDAAW